MYLCRKRNRSVNCRRKRVFLATVTIQRSGDRVIKSVLAISVTGVNVNDYARSLWPQCCHRMSQVGEGS